MNDPEKRNRDSASTEIADRRSSDRIPPKVEPTFVWVSLNRRIRAQLINESNGGIGIVVSEIDPFEIGFEVRVEWQPGRRTATVAHTRELEDGKFHIGLAWA